MLRNISIFTLIIFIVITACKKVSDPFQVEKELDYYPLEVGNYIVYEVDSIIYNPTGIKVVDTTKTFFREEIVDTLQDNEGNTLFKIEKFEKKDWNSEWAVSKVLSASVIDNQAFRTEDNLKFMPLVFPLRENKSWNGNVFFDPLQTVVIAGETLEMFKDWSSHRMRDIGEPESIGNLNFDEVLTVNASNSTSNKIEFRSWQEKYAKGIGLVYKEVWVLDTQCEGCCNGDFITCDLLPWEEKAEKGFILRQWILEHN